MKFVKNILITLIIGCFMSCNFSYSPHGSRPNNPYFITRKSMTIKEVSIPMGTRLEYEKKLFKEGKQSRMMNEKYLTTIELPEGDYIMWGGVPVTMIYKFFNTEMSGYSVYADFTVLNDKKTTFYKLWKEQGCNLGITVKNRDDWSFNKENILDVESCSVLYQRYFKDDKKQQDFLDAMYTELMKVDHK